MKFEGERLLECSQQQVWSVIFEPDFMAQVVPGCKEIKRPEENEYHVKLVLAIPAVQGQYKGVLRILEKEPKSRIRMGFKGEGALGIIEGEGLIGFNMATDNSTEFKHTINVEIKGPMASMAGNFMQMIGQSIISQSLDVFSQKLMKINQSESADSEGDENSGAELSELSPQTTNVFTMIMKAFYQAVVQKMKKLIKRN